MKIKIFLNCVFQLLLIFSSIVSAQTEVAPLDDNDKKELIVKVCDLLKDNYIFPELGVKYGQELLTLYKTGEFKKINDPKEFGEYVTSALHNITKDKHFNFRMIEKSDFNEDEQGSLHHPVRYYGLGIKEHLGVFRLDWIENEIGYMDYRRFYYQDEAKEMLIDAMNFLSSANAIIIDLRENQGGSGKLIPLLCSYFLPYPTQLTGTYYRKDDVTDEWWTLKNIEGKRLLDVPLFILISKKTFSAAEYFAYDLKVRKRVTFIGEPTKGGAHSVDVFPVGERFEFYIPTARAINPVTGSNWEGEGIIPDVLVPSESALDTAIVLAKKSAQEYGKIKDAHLMGIIDKMQNQLDQAESLFNNGGDTEATTFLDSAFQTGLETGMLNKFFIEVLAYYYTSHKLYKMAIRVLKKQTELFPDSPDAYESLAWIYYDQKEKELALQYFTRVLALDQNNSIARNMLNKLK